MPEEFTTYLLALEVAPMTVGRAYEQLPMHCTIMHRFHTTLSAAALEAALRPIVSATLPVLLIPTQHQAFGPRKQLATLIELTAPLQALHRQLYEKLTSLDAQYTESDWVGDGYTPHVTDKQGRRLPTKTQTVCAAVYLISVEHPLQGTKRFIEARLDFST